MSRCNETLETLRLRTFEEHPGERAQEEEVQQAGHDAADDPLIRLADPADEEHLGYQQAYAEILVDRRPVRLQAESITG